MTQTNSISSHFEKKNGSEKKKNKKKNKNKKKKTKTKTKTYMKEKRKEKKKREQNYEEKWIRKKEKEMTKSHRKMNMKEYFFLKKKKHKIPYLPMGIEETRFVHRTRQKNFQIAFQNQIRDGLLLLFYSPRREEEHKISCQNFMRNSVDENYWLKKT